MNVVTAHPSTHSIFDFLIWVPTALYAVLCAMAFAAAGYWTDSVSLTVFSMAVFALFALAHRANARRIRELDAALRHLRDTLR